MNLFWTMFTLGLITGFHCVMMCGNMVLTYAVKGDEEGSLLERLKPHFAYHGAKIASYTLVGAVLGALGVFIDETARSWVSLLAGTYMVLLGLGMTPWFPWLRRLSPRPPKFFMTMLSKVRKKAVADAEQGESTLLTPIAFGLITGLMPCGPLQAAQLKAAAAGNPALGALAMMAFGLGTMPLMLGYGAAASWLNKRLKNIMPLVAAAFIVVLGLIMVNRGAMALGSPVNFNTIKTAVIGGQTVALDESQFKTGADGVVEVPLVIENVRYVPSTLAIPADKPVRLVVERRENNVCSEQLWIPQLGIQAVLAPNGVTTIDIPASKAGSYQMTCQMGMMAGTLQVGAGVASSGAPNVLPLMLFVGGGLLGLNYWSKQRKTAQAASRTGNTGGGKSGSGTGGKSGGKSGGRQLEPAPAGAGLLGFTSQETTIVVIAVVAAVIAGLAFGGYFG